jgi:hypothetical protein
MRGDKYEKGRPTCCRLFLLPLIGCCTWWPHPGLGIEFQAKTGDTLVSDFLMYTEQETLVSPQNENDESNKEAVRM